MVCYPIVFDLSDFYLSQDVMLLIDDIKVSGVTLMVLSTAEPFTPAGWMRVSV